MQTSITARHFELTPQMKAFVAKKLERIERYSQYVMNAEIILAKDAAFELVEGKIHLKHEVITAKVEAKDLYEAVSEMIDRLLTQLKRHDERVKDRRRRSSGPSTGQS